MFWKQKFRAFRESQIFNISKASNFLKCWTPSQEIQSLQGIWIGASKNNYLNTCAFYSSIFMWSIVPVKDQHWICVIDRLVCHLERVGWRTCAERMSLLTSNSCFQKFCSDFYFLVLFILYLFFNVSIYFKFLSRSHLPTAFGNINCYLSHIPLNICQIFQVERHNNLF